MICGVDRMTFQPAARPWELTGLLLMRAWHLSRNDHKRRTIIIPDSAHGTNPASAAMVGFEIREIRSGPDGLVDLDALEEALDDETAGLMLTCPNTLGLFEKDIRRIADRVHEAGGLLYYDGANINAILMQARPGDMGFDIVHLNLHKSFSSPHGGGGPGAGPIGVASFLEPFLPVPVISSTDDGRLFLDEQRPLSISRVRASASFAVLIRAYAYILANGTSGSVSFEAAVANAATCKAV